LPTTRSGDLVAYAGGGNGSMVLDHEIVIVSSVHVLRVVLADTFPSSAVT
jgi:hypothetical protein